MIHVAPGIDLDENELVWEFVSASGPGGQNVNKVATAIHLRFDLHSACLPETVRQRLLNSGDSRITADGVVVIKAQNHRTQEKNRAEAITRLRDLVLGATRVPRKRIPTRPGRAAKQKRLEAKKKRGQLKKLRSGTPD